MHRIPQAFSWPRFLCVGNIMYIIPLTFAWKGGSVVSEEIYCLFLDLVVGCPQSLAIWNCEWSGWAEAELEWIGVMVDWVAVFLSFCFPWPYSLCTDILPLMNRLWAIAASFTGESTKIIAPFLIPRQSPWIVPYFPFFPRFVRTVGHPFAWLDTWVSTEWEWEANAVL